MRRKNFILAGVVDAAVVLRGVFGDAHAEQMLVDEGLTKNVIERVLGNDAFARRAHFHAPTSIQ
jgi:hypothetical protein